MAHFRVGEHLYDMDPTTWPNPDVSAVQKELGCPLGKFVERLEEMDVDAIRALIWILRRRTEPDLTVDEVTFTIREFIEATETTDLDVQEFYPTLDFEKREAYRQSLPQDQQERLFFKDGRLKPVGAAAPLGLAASTTSVLPKTSTANTR